MFAKIHEVDNKKILAICDKELIGKEFEDGEKFFCAKERFYKDFETNEKEIKKLFNEVNSINLFGNKCVEIAQKQGLINETQSIIICGIKHAQIYMV